VSDPGDPGEARDPGAALDPRLQRLSAICLDLPEAKREVTGRHAAFRVRGRTFVYFLDDHHGDGIVGLTAKAVPGAAETLVAEDAERFYRPAYLGHRGWVGVRLDTGPVDWDEIAGFVVESYRLCAPKSLARAIS
jgi:predicted DNA-binding protein (MmcQ/YjbR family)